MERSADSKQVFQSPIAYVVLFYLLLLAWTLGTLPLIYRKFLQGGFQGDWLYAVMIGFFYLYTWFWSLGIFYRISLENESRVALKSLRRELQVSAEKITAIEGSRFPGGFGFVRLKLPRESGYLFCVRRNGDLEAILRGIREENPLIKAVRI
jgi:hypothetical protein